MQEKITIPFIGPDNRSKRVSVNPQQTVNLVHAVKGSGAKAPVVLESAPGLDLLGPLGDGPCRTPQMVSSKIRGTQDLYGVWGSKLVAISPNGVAVNIGTLSTTTGTVRIARGRNYIMLVDGSSGYTYDGTNFLAIADADFPSGGTHEPTHCLYLDGFFIVNDANTDNFYISAVEDPTSWNALDFEAASVAPDAALAIAATETLLWVLGDETAQPYYNSGNADFPYALALSGVQEVGILAPQSIAESDAGIFYLATTPEGGRFVYQIQGQSGRVVSNDEQSETLNSVIDPTTATGFLYQQAGKRFYVLQLGKTTGSDPKDSITLVYNIEAGVWERRESPDGTAWRIGGHGILNNRNIGGALTSSDHYELNLTSYKDAGDLLIRRRRSQVYHNHDQDMDWHQVVIDVNAGDGLTSGAGSNPMLKLRYSDDGGRTFGSWLESPMGKQGEYGRRCVFFNLGQSRKRVLEVECSEPIPVTIINAYAVLTLLGD